MAGKKDKKGAAGGKKAEEGVSCNATSKFKVLDYPGVSQPAPLEPAASSEPSSGAANNKDGGGGAQGRRAKASTGPLIAKGLQIGGDSFTKRTKDPAFLQERVSVYDQIKARRDAELSTKTLTDITVAMPDGTVMEKDKEGNAFQAWKSTPYDVACCISQGLADSSTVARVTYSSFVSDYDMAQDGMEGEDTLADAMADGGVEQDGDGAESTGPAKVFLWDMMRPLVGPVSKLELLKFNDDRDAKTVFWHSSAHMMGEALEHLYGCKLTIGPPLAGGFYYDSYMGKDALREDDCTYSKKLCNSTKQATGGAVTTTHESHSRSVYIMTETIPISLILLSSFCYNIFPCLAISLPMSSCL
jgi:threonyl-tRNA synthetase